MARIASMRRPSAALSGFPPSGEAERRPGGKARYDARVDVRTALEWAFVGAVAIYVVARWVVYQWRGSRSREGGMPVWLQPVLMLVAAGLMFTNWLHDHSWNSAAVVVLCVCSAVSSYRKERAQQRAE